MKKSLSSRSLLGLLLTSASTALLPAQVVNPGFETGNFTGWQLSAGARATVVSSATEYPVDPFTLNPDLTMPYAVNPFAGNFFARLEAGTTSLAATETFLGFAAGTLSTPTNDPFGLADAAAFAQTVSLTAGQTYRFNWNFFAVDIPSADVGDDFAFFSATSATTSMFSLLATVSGTGSGNGTGWQEVAFTPQTSGSYRLGFGVANYGDNTINSTLAIDGRPLSSVPEPSTYGLIAAATLLGVVALRRKRRS